MDLTDLPRTLSQSRLPAVTWYGSTRTELSGTVAANWIVKTRNLLQDEFPPSWGDDARGTFAVVGTPTWRHLVWTASLWLDGWTLIEPDGQRQWPHLILTTDVDGCDTDASTDIVVALAPGPLDLVYPGDLPANSIDGVADVAAQPDATIYAEGDHGTTPALGNEKESIDEVVSATNTELPSVERLVLPAADVPAMALAALRQWAHGRGIVVIDRDLHDADALAGILAQERLDQGTDV